MNSTDPLHWLLSMGGNYCQSGFNSTEGCLFTSRGTDFPHGYQLIIDECVLSDIDGALFQSGVNP